MERKFQRRNAQSCKLFHTGFSRHHQRRWVSFKNTQSTYNGDAKEETTSKNINLGIKETRSREEAVNSCISLGCLAGLMKFLAAIFRTKRNLSFLFFFSTFARLTWLLGALSRGRVGIICHANFLNPLSLSLLDRPLTDSRWFCYISQPVLLFIDRRLNSISRMCLILTWFPSWRLFINSQITYVRSRIRKGKSGAYCFTL